MASPREVAARGGRAGATALDDARVCDERRVYDMQCERLES